MDRPLFIRTCFSVLLFLGGISARAQLSTYHDRAVGVTTVVSGSQYYPVLDPIQYGKVRVCSTPASGSPCSPVATVYDLNGNPLSLGSSFGQVTTDVTGQFNFEVAPGTYEIQVAASSYNVPQLQYLITVTAVTPGTVTSVYMENIPAPAGTFTTCATATATTTPDITCTLAAAATHTIWGNTSGSSATPGYVLITAAMLPASITSSTSGNAATATALAATPTACTLPQVALSIAANGNANCSEPSNVTGTATALSATPTQCSGATPLATGISANGNANCTGSSGSSPIGANPASAAAFTSTFYIAAISGTSITSLANESISTAPTAATISDLTFHLSVATPAGDTVAATLYDGGVATALTCTVSSTSPTDYAGDSYCTDTTHSVTIAVNDQIQWEIVPSSNWASPFISIAAKWQGQ